MDCIQKRRLGILTAFLIFAFCFSAKAQNRWNKTYIEDRPTMSFSSIIETDTSYYVTGVISDKLPPYKARAIAARIDSTGNMNQYLSFKDSVATNVGIFWNNLILTKENKYAFTGYAYDSLPSLIFGIFTRTFDSILAFQYYTPNTSAFQGYSLLQLADNNYYITGVRTDSTQNNANIVLTKVDSNGNRIWEKYYDESWVDYARRIILLHNGHLLLGCVRNNLNQTNEHANTWLLEVDTGGNVIRQWFDPNDSTYVAEGLLQTSDGGFIYGAQKKYWQSINDVYKTATIVKMDSSFNKQWSFNDGSYNDITGIYDLEELPDGSFVGCGNKPFYYNDSSVVSGWVVKLSATGQVIWNKIYRGINAMQTLNSLTDIDVLPDGSLIAVGQCQQSGHTPPQVGWFLKLDSNGCEIENCTVGIEEQPQTPNEIKLLIQPNPATNTVQIIIENEMLNGEIKVYNITGQLVLTKKAETENTTLNVSELSKGIYIVSLEKNRKVARTKLVIN